MARELIVKTALEILARQVRSLELLHASSIRHWRQCFPPVRDALAPVLSAEPRSLGLPSPWDEVRFVQPDLRFVPVHLVALHCYAVCLCPFLAAVGTDRLDEEEVGRHQVAGFEELRESMSRLGCRLLADSLDLHGFHEPVRGDYVEDAGQSRARAPLLGWT